jgi:myo-inositol-1-phosphate synthase
MNICNNMRVGDGSNDRKNKISSIDKKSNGTLGVLCVGLGAVSTTLIAGVEAVKRGIAKPVGSLTQMQTIRLGKRSENRSPLIKNLLPLAGLDDLVWGAWDPIPDDAYVAAKKARVLEERDIEKIADKLRTIKPMKAVFSQDYVKNIHGDNVKKFSDKFEAAQLLIEDIKQFKKKHKCERLVMIWCASTEKYMAQTASHSNIEAFEKALKNNSHCISPSMIYAYAALKSGVPFVNGAPQLTVDIPALIKLAEENSVPIAGKDFKTGETVIKTTIAPMLKMKMLGLSGWFSTNILGNRDGEVLADEGSFKSKQMSKLSSLETILQPEMYPDLYNDIEHRVQITYYRPRGDNKESWNNIDIFGWMGYPMQIKINFLCRDSILAAPVALDLILLIDLAHRLGRKGPQEWLSFYFKSPMTIHPSQKPEHDLFIQHRILKNELRKMAGERVVDHSLE